MRESSHRVVTRYRRATVADSAELARTFIASSRSSHVGLLPQAFLDQLPREQADRADLWRATMGRRRPPVIIVATTSKGGIVGFVTGGKERSGDPGFAGEIYAVYVDRGFQHAGVGGELVRRAAAGLRRRRVRSVLVRVLAQSPARRFFLELGGRIVRTEERRIAGMLFKEVVIGWPDLSELTKTGRRPGSHAHPAVRRAVKG